MKIKTCENGMDGTISIPHSNANKTNNYVNICFESYLNILDGGFDDGF